MNASITESNISSYVVVEYMPAHLRASHDAAANSGSYPGNGSVRYAMHRLDAEALLESVEDWARIVRPATMGDVENYGYRDLDTLEA